MNKGTARSKRELCLRQGPRVPEDRDEQYQGSQIRRGRSCGAGLWERRNYSQVERER